jgi:hypothetical protein
MITCVSHQRLACSLLTLSSNFSSGLMVPSLILSLYFLSKLKLLTLRASASLSDGSPEGDSQVLQLVPLQADPGTIAASSGLNLVLLRSTCTSVGQDPPLSVPNSSLLTLTCHMKT